MTAVSFHLASPTHTGGLGGALTPARLVHID